MAGKTKSYSGIWKFEHVFYMINDFKLPFPISTSQMLWFVVSIIGVIVFADVPPLSLINSVLLKYIVIPIAFTWFMSKKTFEGKKPIGFIKSCVLYFIRPHVTYLGKSVKLKKTKTDISVTAVRRFKYVPD